VPFAVLSVVAFLLFTEPRLHRRGEPTSLRRHVRTLFGVMTREPRVRRVLLLAALAGLLSQAVFEFGPLWLVAGGAPAAAYGPYWAALVASLGVGGYLTSKLCLDRARSVVLLAVVLAAAPVALALTEAVAVVVVAQALLAVVVVVVGIRAGLLLHDAVASSVRAGVSSGVGTLSWILFVPFSLLLGWLVRVNGVGWGGWALCGVAAVLGVLLVVSARHAPAARAALDEAVESVETAGEYPPVPTEAACRELVRLATDYLDGVLPPDWRRGLDEHHAECDGCTEYLRQIRAVVDAVERLATEAPSAIG
jgi:Putative zinc-finger